jgi:hypothetical protein
MITPPVVRPARILLLLAFLGALAAPVRAQYGHPTAEIRGYFKTVPLYFGAASPSLQLLELPDSGFLDYSRLRISSRTESMPGLYLNVAAELAAWAGDLDAAPFTGENASFPTLIEARWNIRQSEHLQADFFIDRFNAEGYMGSLSFVLGRQRIAWGSGFFWNPTDVFNPYGPLALDPEDRPGVDALRLDYQLGTVSSVTIAHAVADKPWYYREYADHAATVVRAGTGLGSYDLHVMAAFDRRERTLGLDLTGYLGGAGIHLEAAYVRSPLRVDTVDDPELGAPGDIYGSLSWSEIVAGLDYGLGDGTNLQLEWFHNTGGTTEPDRYTPLAVVQGRLLAVGRDYAVGSLSRPITPLFTGRLVALLNVPDGSAALVPGLDWSASQNVRLMLGAQFFTGPDRSEFGPLPVIGYAFLRLSF